MESLKKLYFYLYLLILVFLALPVIKIGPARIEQILLLVGFIVVFLDDIYQRDIDFKMLFFTTAGAMILILISLNSPYPKIDEKKYFIKFLFIYPTTFYLSAKILQKLTLNEFIKVIDYTLVFYVVSWFVIMYVPLPMSILSKIVHLRQFGFGYEFLPYQGTFFEAGALGIIVGAMLLFSIFGHLEFDKEYKRNKAILLLQFLTLYIMFMSKNKTVWLAYTLILFFMVVYKWYLLLRHSSYYTPKEKLEQDKILNKYIHINSFYLIIGSIAIIAAFFIYNTFSSEPFITAQEFQYKLHHERGAQFKVAWELIEKSDFFGGYGWGFVEPYFKNLHIMGVGDKSGSINSVFLDTWLQGSIIAVIYLLIITYLTFDNRYYISVVVPMYLIFFGLTNPIIAEEYFIFLGFSYSFIKYLDKSRS